MNVIDRIFTDAPAVRERVPLWVGLMGPSGGGKTYSALRIATGVQRIAGGDIYVIDTEARRALHYADSFKFRHVQFDPPHGSLDYLAAVRHCVAKGARTIVIDSMSHEHIGQGGYLLTQEAELDRIAGQDQAKRNRAKFSAWIKPAALRSQMVNGLLQLNVNLVLCFRAKEKLKILPGKEPLERGWMPIAGEELLYEMTCNALLLPKAGGVPTWRSDYEGERLMMKLPRQFEPLFAEQRPLDESIGEAMAQWAAGNGHAEPAGGDLAALKAEGDAAAEAGMEALQAFWTALMPANKARLGGRTQLEHWKAVAEGTTITWDSTEPSNTETEG